jgi:crossover junction endodeoxyribonuclease RuvC
MTNPILVGIDCGAQGAIAYLEGVPNGPLLHIEDMPIDSVQDGKFQRSRVNAYVLATLLSRLPNGSAAFVERPVFSPVVVTDRATGQRRTIQPSAANSGSFGMQFGVVYGVIATLGIAFYDPTPQVWKRAMSVPANKDEARRIASQRFPAFASAFLRKRDDGRAEAALIALYGRQVLLQQNRMVTT